MLNTQSTYSTSPLSIFQSLRRNGPLIYDMTRREIKKKYQGTFLGLAWSFISPLLMLAVYTFIFAVVFKSRWGESGNESRTDFAITVFAGLIVFGIFSDLLNQAPALVIGNANYVKRVIFPLEILSIISAGSTLFNAATSTLVLLLMQLLLRGDVPLTVIFFPLIALPAALLGLGASWFFSALGVYIRDVGQLLGFLTSILFFTSAIFFPVSALPENYQRFIRLNPLVLIIEQSRNVLVYGNLPDWSIVLLLLLISSLAAWIGYWWFQKTRKGFADVL
ncbi:MAG: ABC transporter permease [Anaerolineales bacterium]